MEDDGGMDAALAIVTMLATLAEADRVTLHVRRAPEAAGCPDHDALAHRVRERIGSEPFAPRNSVARRSVVVELVPEREHRLRARVQLIDASGAVVGHRELRGALDCAALTEELTLAVAIAIDPLLLLRAPPAGTDDGAAADDDNHAASAPPEALPSPALPAGTDAAPPRVPIATSSTTTGAVPPVPDAARWSVRAQLLGSTGQTAPLAPGLRAGVTVDHRALFGSMDVRAAAPARMVFGNRAGSIDARTLTFQAAAGGTLRGYVARLRGGAVAEGGVLSAAGVGLSEVREALAPWVAVGARGGLEIEVTRGLALALDLEALFPLVRPRYIDGQTGEVLDVAEPMVWSGGLGVALAMW